MGWRGPGLLRPKKGCGGRRRRLGGALSALAGQPFGSYLLGAVDLVCFGLFMFVVARYRRIRTG